MCVRVCVDTVIAGAAGGAEAADRGVPRGAGPGAHGAAAAAGGDPGGGAEGGGGASPTQPPAGQRPGVPHTGLAGLLLGAGFSVTL